MDNITKRIQRQNNLNEVLFCPDSSIDGVPHRYLVGRDLNEDRVGGSGSTLSQTIFFQMGARNEPASTSGVLEGDLLEIVRHRLQTHQKTKYATRENACALTHVEEALMWLAKRADDRAEDKKLGTNKI